MTLKECYALMHGDYENAMKRLMKEERIIKYLGRFTADPTMSELEKAVAANDRDASFIAAHTLKGVATNLGFTSLAEASSELAEQLRPRTSDPDAELMCNVRAAYAKVIDAIRDFN